MALAGLILRHVPLAMARRALRLAHLLRVIWWRMAKPEIRGCRIIALDGRDRILLVRHTYGSRRWTLPGGGMGRREDATAAARRELSEEVGCALLDPVPIVEVTEQHHGATNHVIIVAGRIMDKPVVDGREVSRAAFFSLSRLPSDMAGPVRKGVQVWVRAAVAACPVPVLDDPVRPRFQAPKA